MNLSEIFKQKREGERDIRLYKRCNFIHLYNNMNIKNVGKNDSMFIRNEWKNLLLDLDYINVRIWKIVRLRRRVGEWDEMIKKELYKIIFELLIKTKDVYNKIFNIINMEKAIWQNVIIMTLKDHKLNKDDVYEIMPYSDIENTKLLFRQIFRPVINLLTELENELLVGNIDENKLKELENIMLISVLPYFENIYNNIIKLQKEVLW